MMRSLLLIPLHSSENRKYIPMGFFDQDSIANNSCSFIPNAGLYHFGVLMSSLHMAWIKTVCGRLESRFRYSNEIVYNNFPWPEPLEAKAEASIAAAAQGVLDARAAFPDSTLADLYDCDVPTPALVKAHQQLDKAVDAAYVIAEKSAGRKPPKLGSDAERVAFLFERYQALTSLLPVAKSKGKGRKTSESQ